MIVHNKDAKFINNEVDWHLVEFFLTDLSIFPLYANSQSQTEEQVFSKFKTLIDMTDRCYIRVYLTVIKSYQNAVQCFPNSVS